MGLSGQFSWEGISRYNAFYPGMLISDDLRYL